MSYLKKYINYKQINSSCKYILNLVNFNIMKKTFFLLSLALVIFSSCEKDNEDLIINNASINGYVQKGPFLNGSSISLYELNDSYSTTGKDFSTQISDNSGSFQINNISLASPYIQIKANGYYFNEVSGDNSSAPITLYALTDITDRTSINVNILTHLEKSRIEYLLSNGSTFSVAKRQAEEEILGIFSITMDSIVDSDLLNISNDGDNNAILLAISVILQGYRTEGDLSELLANISTDIRQDGVLNSASLGTLLINDAKLLNLPQIRTNIENRYNNLGMTVTIPDFERYVNLFINNSPYQFTNNIVYPEYSSYGKNILYGDITSFDATNALSLAAYLPNGASLKIILKNSLWYFSGIPAPINWTISSYDYENQEQTFIVTESGKNCDLRFSFGSDSPITIEYYENNSITPTRTKIIQSNKKLKIPYTKLR